MTRYTTITSTTTSITTSTSTSTSTISAPAGFTALLNAPDYRAKVKARADSGPVVNVLAAPAKQYPQRVDCTKKVPTTVIKTVSTTIQGPRKTLKPQTKTRTTVSTETVTETIYPEDVTITTTETVSPTVTEFEDATVQTVATETGESIRKSRETITLIIILKLPSRVLYPRPTTRHAVVTTNCELPMEAMLFKIWLQRVFNTRHPAPALRARRMTAVSPAFCNLLAFSLTEICAPLPVTTISRLLPLLPALTAKSTGQIIILTLSLHKVMNSLMVLVAI